MQGKLQDKTGEHLCVTKVDMMDEDHYNVYVDRYSGDAISYEYYSQTNPIDESHSTTKKMIKDSLLENKPQR